MDQLFEKFNSVRFGLISTRILLIIAIVLACCPFEPTGVAENPSPVTFLSSIPADILADPGLLFAMRAVLIVSALLWFFCLLTPLSCWITVLAVGGLWAVRVENSIFSPHIFHVGIMLLLIHAAWFTFYRRQIVYAFRAGETMTTFAYPYWVFWLSVFYIGWFHTLAGVAKLRAHGWQWADGTSLQLWTHAFGYEGSPVTQMIVSNQPLAMLLQQGTLVIETAAILCVLGRPFRWLVGLTLLGFYGGVLTSFVDYGFHFNAFLTAWFLLLSDFVLQKWRQPEAGDLA